MNTLTHSFRTIVPMSHLIGSISGIVTKYILDAFPEGYFKAIWNSEEEPFLQRKQAYRDIMLKPRPILLIKPEFDPSEEADFRPLSEFDNEVANLTNSPVGLLTNNICFIDAPNFRLYFRPRRYKMKFEISCVFDSDIQRIQAQMYIRQSIRHRFHIVISKFLESIIPTEYLNAIAAINNMKVGSSEFENFINKYSKSPIRYRYRTGSGNHEYFLTVDTPMQAVFTDGPTSTGPVTSGNITISSAMSESIEVEFTAPSMFAFMTNADIGKPLKEELYTNQANQNIVVDDTRMRTVAVNNIPVIEYTSPPESIGKFVKYKSVMIQADKNGTDTINLIDLITDENIMHVTKLFIDNKQGIPYVGICCDVNGVIMDTREYSLDPYTLNLCIYEMSMYKTYSIHIYIDWDMISTIIDNNHRTEKDNVLIERNNK